MSELRVWWSTGPSPGNFGDVLTPHILSHYGIRHRWVGINQAQAISTGSIVRFAKPGMMVLGSGVISRQDRIEPKADYRWVRGPITGEMVRKAGGECPEVCGDPAMLLPKVYERTVSPTREVGHFLHYVDLPLAWRFSHAISPLLPIKDVLRKLWECERVVSSSLHGIIAAHAYGIPAAWMSLGKLTGDGAKFHDHAQSVGLPEMPLSTLDDPVFTLPVHGCDIEPLLKGLA